MDLAQKVVNKMLSGDSFSNWLGIEIIEISKGYCKLKMRVREEMTNGFGIAHGGIAFSLADRALAFAANSDGIQSLSVETSISFTKKVLNGDTLIAETKKIKKKEKTTSYEVVVVNQEGIDVAKFNGKVYKTKKKWF